MIDGVLNNDNTQDRVKKYYLGISPELVDNLKLLYDRLVERHGNVKIILSSTWKKHWHKAPHKNRQDEFANRLDEALAAVGLEIEDKIFESYYHRRGYLILNYMEHFPCDGYVIVDDELFDFEELEITDHLIHTNERYGLTPLEIDTYFIKQDGLIEE